jgi:hypothetical protein
MISGSRKPSRTGRPQTHKGADAAPSCEVEIGQIAQPALGGRKLPRATLPAFERDQQRHEDQKRGRQLRRGDPVSHGEPGLIDAGGEGLHAEMRHSAEIGQCFHQGQGDAGHDGRARHGQRHFAKGRKGPHAKRAADFERTDRVMQERSPRQQVHIRVQHQHEHQRCALKRSNIGEPVVAWAPSGHIAQQGLNRAGMVQKICVGVGHDIGRNSQGQDQRPFKEPAPGKPAHGHKPGRGGSNQKDADTHQGT